VFGRQRTSGDAAWKDRSGFAHDHLERGNRELQASYDRERRCERDQREQEHDDPEGSHAKVVHQLTQGDMVRCGTSSCSRRHTAEVGTSPIGSAGGLDIKNESPSLLIGRPMSPSSNPKPVAPLVVLAAMLPIVDSGQSKDGTFT
jgi:hypothetical protein